MDFDYLIVGAGFAGSVCARCLADEGNKILIIDKREHLGGNAYDKFDEAKQALRPIRK
jgi:UDP-galactopyranose mutase